MLPTFRFRAPLVPLPFPCSPECNLLLPCDYRKCIAVIRVLRTVALLNKSILRETFFNRMALFNRAGLATGVSGVGFQMSRRLPPFKISRQVTRTHFFSCWGAETGVI